MHINHNFTSTSTWERRSQSNLVQDLSWHANFSWTLSIWSWTFQFKFGSNLLLVLLTRRPVECEEQGVTTLTSIYIAFTIFGEGSYENDPHRFQQEKALAGASLNIVQHRFKCQNCRTLEECGEWRVESGEWRGCAERFIELQSASHCSHSRQRSSGQHRHHLWTFIALEFRGNAVFCRQA